MPSKIWIFELDEESHTVELEYSLVSARERFRVDDKLLSDELRWTLHSRYPFQVGEHSCLVVLSIGIVGLPTAKLMVDGKPVEMLPCKTLLRPAQASGTGETTLLRAATATSPGTAAELLRPAGNEENSAS